MGMDVHGLNPIQNKKMSDFPTLNKMDKFDKEDKWKEKWEVLDNDTKMREKYWAEKDEYESANKGVYFRNNCWWWRPLWDYCYYVSDGIISEELHASGHHNDGSGLNGLDAKKLGELLLEKVKNGEAESWRKAHDERNERLRDGGDEFAASYPFDVDNVRRFAEFCIESGGFEIC